MKALITGMTGFVGSHLAEHLLACGDEVIGTSHSGRWGRDAPDVLRDQIEVFRWDISLGPTEKAIRRMSAFMPDVIYHLGAISVPSDCGADQPTLEAIAVNIDGTRAIIEAVQCLPVQPRLVFASSCYVYGAPDRDQFIVSESTPCHPVHGYGITKLAAEQELTQAAERRGLEVVIARSFQHSGPRQSPQMVLPDWARQLRSNGGGPIRAICLDTYLDISDVRDVVRAYRMLCVSGRRGMVYNVGSGVCRRAGDLLEMMKRICSSRRDVRELAPGRRQHPIADIQRIVQHTGWTPAIPLEETLTDILEYWNQKERIS